MRCKHNSPRPQLGSAALVDTWSVRPSPGQPRSPRASPARTQNVLPRSPASRNPQMCPAQRVLSLSRLAEPPQQTQDAGSSGEGSSSKTKLRNPNCTGPRAAELLLWVTAHWERGRATCLCREHLRPRKLPAQHGRKDRVTADFQGRSQPPSPLGEGAPETSRHGRAPEFRAHQAAAGSGAATLEKRQGTACLEQATSLRRR